jgi:MOSC domain-containing protein YiiM
MVSMTEHRVVAVHASLAHSFSKDSKAVITLREGLGVVGDAHYGAAVQHRSRIAADPSQPNLRQVHLIHAELLDRLAAAGFAVAPGELGENITTRGVDLVSLPVGARLVIGQAVVTVTGLRNPCQQINTFQPGLLKHVVRTTEDGTVERVAGVMGIVSRSGEARPGDPIGIDLPPEPHLPLTLV